jgi:two-component system copper resistance phosphate regulon response regulator CusR
MTMQVLLIEDEKNISSFISKGLEAEGYDVTPAYDGETGLALFQGGQYQFLILDVILPHMNGWEICKRIRQEHNNEVPILMLSALNETDHIVKGLNAGADDYLAKPFKMSELLARIKALSRRSKGYVPDAVFLEYGGLKVDSKSREVWRDEVKIKLTVKEFNLLVYLMKNPDKALSRMEILEHVWGIDFDINTNVVDVYVNYLRRKIDKEFDHKLIQTVFGIGYILRADDSEK